jgi:EAL domain-containing protein (putative c-di-GMP-specific phosphodiesterase class I)
MPGRRAVLIGVNRCALDQEIPDLRFAEADATALRDLLTDRRVGTFDPDDVQLLVGEAATLDAVTATLRSAVLAAQQSDVLFVYFAGHGFLPPWDPDGDPYLTTYDFTAAPLRLHPHLGLRMRFLRQDVFEKCHGTSFLVLDCCHAGGYADAQRSGASDRGNALLNALGSYESQLSRHTALMACPRDATTRETNELEHGVFTHHLLIGLRGAAAGNDGRVTFADAASFVKQRDIQPPVGLFARDWGPTTVLTQPAFGLHPTGGSLAPRAPEVTFVACANPLDASVGAIRQLLDRIFRLRAWSQRHDQNEMIETISQSVQADGAAIVDFSPTNAAVREASAGFHVDELSGLFEQVRNKSVHNRRATLGYLAMEESGRQVLSIPLAYDSKDGVSSLIVVNPTQTFVDLGEPLAIMLRTLWLLADTTNARLAEVEVLTALRANVGRVPLELYNYCFDVYREVLRTLVMVFEPVMELSPNPRSIGIHSYEALARPDAHATRAPGRALGIAHTWGDQFIIERDSNLAENAIRSYAKAHDRGPYHDHVPRPVSINVAVRALLSEAYVAALRRTIADTGLAPRNITLEISESDAIAPAADEKNWLPDAATFFRERLADLAERLRVNFAVDDFGVGYASLDRVSTLPLTQIKVDRAILLHPVNLALEELALVVRVARHAMRHGDASTPRPVIVEGVDDKSHVSLKDIYDRDIHFVQGYITEMPASVDLHALSSNIKERIAAKVRGDDDQRQAQTTGGSNVRTRVTIPRQP